MLNIFKKNMTVRSDVFLMLGIPKNVVRTMSKKSRFSLPFKKQHGKQVPTLSKSERQHFCLISWSMWKQLSCKKSPLVICKIFRIFLNTLSAVGKYSLLNTDNLMQSIEIQLSQKQKTFPQFFSSFLKCSLNFEHFQAKDYPHSWCISEITDSEKRG